MGAKITGTSPPCDIGLDDVVGNHRPISSVYNITNLSFTGSFNFVKALDRNFQELLEKLAPRTALSWRLFPIPRGPGHLEVNANGLLLSTSCLM